MKALNIFKHFARDEDGAVTVDWVVLTAAIVGLGIIVMTAVNSGVGTLASDIQTSLEGAANNPPPPPG